MKFWQGKRVLVTGGAGLVGSHVTDRLCCIGAKVRVADNLSTGKREFLDAVRDRIELVELDLRVPEQAARAVESLLRLGLATATPGRTVNLAMGQLISVRSFAETAARILQIPFDRLKFGSFPT
jgi:nucleoside-diphosphate-sugar epimerase